MRALKHAGLPPLVHGKHAYGVQPQEQQIHQVFMRKAVRNKVGMHKAQTAQTARARTNMRQFGDENGGRVPDDDHIHPPLTIQRKTYLTRQQTGQRRKFARLFGAVASLRRIATLSQSVESLQFAGLQTGGVSFNPSGYCTPPAIQVAIMSS